MPQTIHVRAGETFEVSLEGTAGTGFRWEFDALPATVGLVSLLEERREAVSTLPGGRTIQHFRFQALSPGKLDLTFRFRRAWETSTADTVQTTTVQIDAPA